jgi:hypothetical protein
MKSLEEGTKLTRWEKFWTHIGSDDKLTLLLEMNKKVDATAFKTDDVYISCAFAIDSSTPNKEKAVSGEGRKQQAS